MIQSANVRNKLEDTLLFELYNLKASWNQRYFFFQQINEEIFYSKCLMSCYYMSVQHAATFAHGQDKNRPRQGVK